MHCERRWAAGVCALAVSAALATASCGSESSNAVSTPPPPPATTGLRNVPSPAITTPEGVAVAALREIFTWYPAQEKPSDSFRRARQWLGPSLTRLANGAGPASATTSAVALPPPSSAAAAPSVETAPPPSLRWNEWATAGAVVEAFAFASGEVPADTDPARVLRKIGIEQTVVYRDRREPLPSIAVIATLIKTDAGWRLDQYQ